MWVFIMFKWGEIGNNFIDQNGIPVKQQKYGMANDKEEWVTRRMSRWKTETERHISKARLISLEAKAMAVAANYIQHSIQIVYVSV